MIKKYIKDNLTPIMIGVTVGMWYDQTLETIGDIIIKLTILYYNYH